MNPYRGWSHRDLLREIEKEKTDADRLRAELKVLQREALEARRSYQEVSRRLRELTPSMEGLEAAVFTHGADLERVRDERDRTRRRLDYWRNERREARGQRRRLTRFLREIPTRRTLLSRIRSRRLRLPMVGIVTRTVLFREIGDLEGQLDRRAQLKGRLEEARGREREAEARYRVELRGFQSLKREAEALGRKLESEEREFEGVRREIVELPDPTLLIEQAREREDQAERVTREISGIEEELKLKEEALPVKIVEVTAYLNYVEGMKGGKGVDREYKILRWVLEDEVDAVENETMRLWINTFDFLVPMINMGDIQYGVTNREDEVSPDEFDRFKDYVLAIIIIPTDPPKVGQAGVGTITSITRYGYAGVTWHRGPNALAYVTGYHETPTTAYKGMKT